MIRAFEKLVRNEKHQVLINELRELVKERNFYAINILPLYNEELKKYKWSERVNLESKNLLSYSYLLEENEWQKYSVKHDEINARFGYLKKDFSIEGNIDMRISEVFDKIISDFSVLLGENLKNIKLDYSAFKKFEELVYKFNKIEMISTSNF